ncbi:MAG: TonB-dependent receptor, partial [Caulobacteraceae bacterium]
PYGFLPLIQADDDDSNIFAGIKGAAYGWNVDLSLGWGKNSIDYNTIQSVNRSYGIFSKTAFYDGGYSYDQSTIGLDVSRGFDVGLAEPLNVAGGLQYREENYEIHPGEPASYNDGGQGGGLGAQGFGGFQPSNAADADRHNWAAYVDLEGKFTQNFSYGLAGRYEDYSDFGDQATGKLSLRYDITPQVAIRGAISNGFKAPALQQQYFSYTATNLNTTTVGGVPVTSLIQSGKFRVNDPVAISLGARPLEPETSMNYSVGAVYRFGSFQMTVDAYQIDIEDRITLSENLGSGATAADAQVRTILAPYGVSAAQFFLNGVDTTTKGVDIVAHYRMPTESYGRFDFTVAANFNDTKVTRVPTTAATTAIGASSTFLFNRANRLSYEFGQPEQKIIASVDWFKDGLGLTARATNYDSVLLPNNVATLDQNTGTATLVDLAVRY